MATFKIAISGSSNVTGSTNFKVKYRLAGTDVWSSFLIPVPDTSGTTAVIPQDSPTHVLLDNRIYEFQLQNLNGADNPLSLIMQDMGITDPTPVFSPTSSSVGYSFSNLSPDIDSYTVQLTTVADPGTILQTHTISAGVYPNTLTDSFTGLSPLVAYRIVISPVANQFTSSFVHNFTTLGSGGCANVSGVTVSIS